MRKTLPLILFLLCSVAFGAEQMPLGAHGGPREGLKVIEEKCLVCHNRKRIEDAARERKDMERIVRLMEKKGVALTEKEQSVLAHFWKRNPFKEKAKEPQQQ